MIQAYPKTDELMDRYYALAFTQEIQSISQYALDWKLLAEDAAKAGRPVCAEAWAKRGMYYAEQAGIEKKAKSQNDEYR